MCDTMVALGPATRLGQSLFAKNSDRPAGECQPLVQIERSAYPPGSMLDLQFVTVPQAPVTFRHVGSRPYWCRGYEHGFNEHQVVIGNEGLQSRYGFDEPKLIGMELVRLGLERGRTAREAVSVMTELIERAGQGAFPNNRGVQTYDNGYLVVDPNEAYVIEAAGHDWAVQRARHTVGISNVYSIGTDWDELAPQAERHAAERGWWQAAQGRLDFGQVFRSPDQAFENGAERRDRSCALLAAHAPELDAAMLMRVLADHAAGESPDALLQNAFDRQTPGWPSICVHANADGSGSNTAASLVADLCADGSRLPVYWCSLYSPCLSLFFPVFLEGRLPAELGLGGAEPGAESPWWLFHRLARAVRADPSNRVSEVRERWTELQESLIDSAYALAGEARRALDAGDAPRAEDMLTRYMARNLEVMLERAAEMAGAYERQTA